MITVTILSKNAEETLQATLESVASFSEVLLFDTGSTDRTLEIARSFANVRILQAPFTGFGPSHNAASSAATHDWILSIDSDEVLSPLLTEEIQALNLNPFAVYTLRRKNFFNRKWIRGCSGWDPDWVTRLYNRQKTHFSDDQVHEKVLKKNLKEIRLTEPLLHTPYRKIEHFLTKMQTYSTLFAEQHQARKRSSLCKALLHSWSAFLKSYFFKLGFLNGKEGFIISVYNGHVAFYKYLKLDELNG